MSELVYAFAAISAIALLMEILAQATPAAMAQMPKVRAARQRYHDAQATARKALEEIVVLKAKRDQLTDDVMLVDARVKDAKRRAAAYSAGRPIFVHEFGKNAPDRRLYEAYVKNPLVRMQHKPANIERINPIYGDPQLVEVWAEGLVEARQLLDRAYPGEDGFEIEYSGHVIDPIVQKQQGI